VSQTLLPFQRATVDQAVSALQRGSGVRRFLLADEVGLGKTVVASAIVRSLAQRAKRRKKPFCVFYFASNLALLEQNRRHLENAVSPEEGLTAESFPEDRLPLGWRWESRADLRVAVFTPSTSLPDLLLGRLSTGRRVERELAVAFVRLITGRALDVRIRRFLAGLTINETDTNDALRQRLARFDAGARRRRRQLEELPMTSRRELCSAFARSLAHWLGLGGRPRGSSIYQRIKSLVQTSEKVSTKKGRLIELRKWLRIALVEATLARGYLRPDLIIFDEFQNYREVLAAPAESLTSRLLLHSRVLLLSATPFGRAVAGAPEQRIVDLTRFLYREFSHNDEKELRALLRKYRELLLAGPPPDLLERMAWREKTLAAKRQIEKRLRPVIERTQRWDDEQVAAALEPNIRTDLTTEDLLVFDDFATRLRRAAERRRSADAMAHATPLWMSVPYPVQALPAGYVASRALALGDSGLSGRRAPTIAKPAKAKPPSAMHRAVAHPKLRCFVDSLLQPEVGSLPWLAPSRPWWQLAGPWSATVKSVKSLVFSHYRATPPAVGALLSREIERVAGPIHTGWQDVPRNSRFATGGSGRSRDLLALFFPWHVLACEFDPLIAAGRTRSDVVAAAKAFVKDRLFKLFSVAALSNCEFDNTKGRSYVVPEIFSSLFRRRQTTLSPQEDDQDYLALVAVGAPGVILLRVFLRHYHELIDAQMEQEIAETAWRFLRPYLGQRYFDRSLAPEYSRRRSRGHRAAAERLALLGATIDGNLEAVLDEHLSVWRRLNAQRDTPTEALKELKDALSLQAGAFALHERRKKKRVVTARLRAHAAVAFSGQEAEGARSGSKMLRPSRLLAAFNSPFWPNVLISTSVGQEGLNFHVWCSRLVHWDVPRSHIDLEQREGRITRFGSHAVRRALGERYGTEALVLAKTRHNFSSPWQLLEELVDKEYSGSDRGDEIRPGLQPWWVTPGGEHERIVLAPSFSHEATRFERMLEELDLYRLGYGQPDPKKFIDRLRGKLTRPELRELAIDLSGAKLRSGQAGKRRRAQTHPSAEETSLPQSNEMFQKFPLDPLLESATSTA